MAWSSVRSRWTEPYASRCANARSRSSSPSAALRKERSAYASCSKTRNSTSYAARRAGETLTGESPPAEQVLVPCHPALAVGLHLQQLERPVLADARLPDEQRPAVDDGAGADVRRECADTVHN